MIYKNVELYNIVEVFPIGREIGKGLCRIPLDLRAKLNDSAQANAIQTPGAEIRFNLQGEYATVTLQMTGQPAIAEVYYGPFLVAWEIVQLEPTELVVTPPERAEILRAISDERQSPYAPGLFRVALPWRPPVRLHGVEGDVSPPEPPQSPARRYLAYGSSITHGNNSVGARGGYALQTAHHLDVDLINLGFGGGAHCEPEMADYIAARTDWDFATLEMGINLVSWLETAEFAERVDYFVNTIAAAHPDKWIFCIDMFPFYMDFQPESERNHAYRAVVRETVERLNMPTVVHLDGRNLLRDAKGLCADAVHPAPAGMAEIATNLTSFIQRMMTS
ncbi:MAG: GDSL-type esterase/lipase family protein [Anaerolineae bacterium]